MPKTTTFRNMLAICLTLCFSIGFSQAADFQLTVTKTDETCTGNGSLAFNVSDVPAGASVFYVIYKHPDLVAPLVSLPGNSYGGLSAGTYRVVANVTINGISTSQFVDIEIQQSFVQLQYSLIGQPDICNGNGQITVVVTQGTAVGYEIISGPQIRPLQTSNVFSGLTAGLYEIRVFDACGEGIVQAHTLFSSEPGMNLVVHSPVATNCDTIMVTLEINEISTFDIAYPIEIQLEAYPPTGPPIILNQTITTGTSLGTIFSEEIPYTSGEIMSYTITVTDSCGNQQEASQTLQASSMTPSIVLVNQTCTGSGITITNVAGVVLDVGPEAVTFPFDYTSMITNGVLTLPSMPLGLYEFTTTGVCGQIVPLTIEVIPGEPTVPGVSVFEGCEPGTGSVYIGGFFNEMWLLSAPSEFGDAYPLDVSEFIDSENGGFVMSGLPPGTYSFNITDTCGNLHVQSGTISGYSGNTIVNVLEHCGAFDLQISHTSNASGSTSMWLQQFNPVTGEWFNPQNGVVYQEGTPPGLANSIQLVTNGTKFNLAYSGTFRILMKYPIFLEGVALITSCHSVVHEFQTTGVPVIEQVYSFSCDTGTFDVIVEASGMMPLTYRITSQNGTPVMVDNGNVNVFNGLAPGSYSFQVEDACQNIVNRAFDIIEPLAFEISATTFCAGEDGTLSVTGFPFLNYQWFKNDAPSLILSTEAELQITDYSVEDAGTYTIRIWNSDPFSCLDITLEYELPAPSVPQSGTGIHQDFCGVPGQIDLFTLLSPPYDLNGSWSTTAPGTISGNLWIPNSGSMGEFTFEYEVAGCPTASTSATVSIKPLPDAPQILPVDPLCEGADLIVSLDAVPGTEYHWQGPGGFTHAGNSVSLPGITPEMAGEYSVRAVVEGCESGITVFEVDVIPAVAFSVSQFCDGNVPTLRATLEDPELDESLYDFHWTGPGGFSAFGNPVASAGAVPGVYQLQISGGGECIDSVEFEVTPTVCGIPQGISANDDGKNESFDLTGLGVKSLRIFNRYGMVVYEKVNYADEWNGRDYNGNLLPAATYYYLIQLESGEARTGWVYLMH